MKKKTNNRLQFLCFAVVDLSIIHRKQSFSFSISRWIAVIFFFPASCCCFSRAHSLCQFNSPKLIGTNSKTAEKKKKWSQVCWSFGYIHQSSSTQFRFMATIHHYIWLFLVIFIFISFRSPACVTYIYISYMYTYIIHITRSFHSYILCLIIIIRRWIVDKHHRAQLAKNDKPNILFIQRNDYCCIVVCFVQQYEWTKNETLNNPMPGCLNATDTRTMCWTKCDERWFVPSLDLVFLLLFSLLIL